MQRPYTTTIHTVYRKDPSDDHYTAGQQHSYFDSVLLYEVSYVHLDLPPHHHHQQQKNNTTTTKPTTIIIHHLLLISPHRMWTVTMSSEKFSHRNSRRRQVGQFCRLLWREVTTKNWHDTRDRKSMAIPSDSSVEQRSLRQVGSTPVMLTPSNLPRTPSVTTAYAFSASIYDVLIDKANERKPVVYYILQMTGELVGSGAEKITWNVSRRYSSFVQLKGELAVVGFTDLPPLPPKTWFVDRLNPSLIEKRKIELTSFVNAMIRNRELFKTRLVRYFLKTSDFFKKRSASSIRRDVHRSRIPSINETREDETQTSSHALASSTRQSRLGQSVSIVPSPSALTARDPSQSREVSTTLSSVAFNGGEDIDAAWGDPVTFIPSYGEQDDDDILSWMPSRMRLQMQNEKVFLTVDPNKITESDLLGKDGIWIQVDESATTANLSRCKIKLLVQRERLRSFSNGERSTTMKKSSAPGIGLPVTVLLIVLPFLLSYLILFTDYNSDSMLAFSALTVIVSIYALKGILHESPFVTAEVSSQSDNGTVVCRTVVRFVDCELPSESVEVPPAEQATSAVPVASPSENRESKVNVFVNHSGTWIVDSDRSKTTYEPMLIALGISWPLRMLVRSLKTEMRVKHTMTHINRRDHFQNSGKPVAKDSDNHIFPLDGKTYFKRDDKGEDVYVTHNFYPEDGGCVESITLNKTKNIKIVDRQRLIDDGKALHHTIETWAAATPNDKPAKCDVIKYRTTSPIEGAFDKGKDGENLVYNVPAGWTLVADDLNPPKEEEQ